MNIVSITPVKAMITGHGSLAKSFAPADVAHCHLMSRLPAKMSSCCRLGAARSVAPPTLCTALSAIFRRRRTGVSRRFGGGSRRSGGTITAPERTGSSAWSAQDNP